jgi:hypothetical protein
MVKIINRWLTLWTVVPDLPLVSPNERHPKDAKDATLQIVHSLPNLLLKRRKVGYHYNPTKKSGQVKFII